MATPAGLARQTDRQIDSVQNIIRCLLSIQELLNDVLDASQVTLLMIDAHLGAFPLSLIAEFLTVWDHISSILNRSIEIVQVQVALHRRLDEVASVK